MIWQNAWAALGLTALALPVLIHLLGRRPPRPQRFPTLRFLEATRVVPARRHRLNDLPLLALRLAVLTAAVLALARPWFTSIDRAAESGIIARAIVLDTSASMARPARNGRPALETARDLGETAQAGVRTARVIESESLGAGVSSAVAWLLEQHGRRELVVVSDFQRGALDESDVAAVPAEIGIRLTAVDMAPADAPITTSSVWGSRTWRTSVGVTTGKTTAAWMPEAASTGLPPFLGALVAPADEDALGRAVRAARLEGVPAVATGRPVTIVFGTAPARASLTASARLPDEAWMFDVTDDVRSDAAVAALARTLDSAPGRDTSAALTPLVSDRTGTPRLYAAARDGDAAKGLLLFVFAQPGDAFSAAVMAATWRSAAADTTRFAEAETTVVGDATLGSWRREPAEVPAPPTTDTGRSDGRWFWLLALGLLGVEAWVRRTPGAAPQDRAKEAPHARVA